MAQPEPTDFEKIEEVAQQEAEAAKPRRRGRPTREEDQLFGHRRQARTVWHFIKITYLVSFAAIALAAILSLFWNWFAPANWRWLSADQITEAQKFLFSGTIGGVLALGFSLAIGKQRQGE